MIAPALTPLARAWQRLAQTADGRAVLGDLLKEGRLFQSAYAAGDPAHTAYLQGKRDLALRALRLARLPAAAAMALHDEAERGTHARS